MEELVLSTGIEAGEGPPHPDRDRRRRVPAAGRGRAADGARRVLGLPASAFVVGSFQKDGVGWGEGLEPKLIKGPDVLLAAPSSSRRGARAPSPSHRPGPRLRARRSRAARHPLPPRPVPGRRRGGRGLSRDRRLPGRVARRGRAAGGARGDGDPCPARHDAESGRRRISCGTARTAGWSSREDVDGLVASILHVARAGQSELEGILDSASGCRALQLVRRAADALARAARRFRGAAGTMME